jgi:hypothetical protein
MNAGFRRLNRIMLIMDRGSGTCQVIDAINLHVQREGNVVTDQFESRICEEMLYVSLAAGEKIVYANHISAVFEQSLTQVGAQEAGATGYQGLMARVVVLHSGVHVHA